MNMENVKKKFFSFKTPEGCKRLLFLFLALIILFSAVARLIASDFGNVKITRVYFDSRGAMIEADLYYPAGTSDEDKLPAVLLAHGGGVTNGNMKGFAEELARRGFVVLNVNSYGVGLSEQPVNDDGGQGIHGFDRKATPAGMIDALNYVRTLKFVDQTRVGSETLGKIYETSVTDNVQLQEAIDNRSTRIVSFNAETHSKNFFSTQTTADVVKYFEQTLGYNCGELSDPTTTPLDVNNSVFMWREYLNTFAMLSMVMMCIALAGTLLGTKFFAPCVATPYRGSLGVFNKTKYSRQKERHDFRYS